MNAQEELLLLEGDPCGSCGLEPERDFAE